MICNNSPTDKSAFTPPPPGAKLKTNTAALGAFASCPSLVSNTRPSAKPTALSRWGGVDLTGCRMDRNVWDSLSDLVKQIHSGGIRIET